MNQEYTYKFRFYPTKEQGTLLAKHFGCIRWTYNYFLNRRTQHYLESKEKQLKKKSLNYNDDAKRLTELKHEIETNWLTECNAQSLQHSLKHLDTAFSRFFKKKGKYPRFKSRRKKNSFRVPQFITVENNRIFFPKFKEGIRIELHRPIEGEIRNATISMNSAGQYYASIGVQRDIPKKPKSDKMIGIDLGIKTLVVCSDGSSLNNPKPFKTLENRIKTRNKAHSRKQKGSSSKEKSRKKLAKLHLKIANIRNDHLHKISSKLIDENQVIIMESLNVKGMLSNRKLSKSIWDCSWSELVRQIEYKAKWYGRQIVRVDRFFPSSKTCSSCGFINQNLTLADREWTCSCGIKHDRDFNAAKMILKQGMNLLNKSCKESTVGTTDKADCLGVSLSSNGKQLIGSETQRSLAAE